MEHNIEVGGEFVHGAHQSDPKPRFGFEFGTESRIGEAAQGFVVVTLREFNVDELIQQVLRRAGRLALVLVSHPVLLLAFSTAIVSTLALTAALHGLSRAGIDDIVKPLTILDHKRRYAR